ncbi:MAG: DNA-binding protein [Gemmatimonadetes bacterium]|nr:DNA-binding protein [Gemmatimonadota bacterium]
MKRTTIFLDEPLLRRAQAYARRHGVSFATVIREAVSGYLAGGATTAGRLPSVTGQFDSGTADTASRVDELLWRDPHGR